MDILLALCLVMALSAGVLSLLALTVPLLAVGLAIGLLIVAAIKVLRFLPSWLQKLRNN